MKKQRNQHAYWIYLPESQTHEPVSEEIYYAYYRPIWRTFKKEHYHKRCICSGHNWHLCSGDCFTCSFHIEGDRLSLDAEMGNEDDSIFTLYETFPDDAPLIESLIEDVDLRSALLRALEKLDPESRAMCRLIMEGFSERQAANRMNMARSTFRRHWSRVREILAKRLEDYR